MIHWLAQVTNPLEYTIAGVIVLCATSIAVMLSKAAVKREEKKVAAYENDLNLRRLSDDEDRRLRREAEAERIKQEKEHHDTIETLTKENHRQALVQMKERTQLDSKNLETLNVISGAVEKQAQSNALILEMLKGIKHHQKLEAQMLSVAISMKNPTEGEGEGEGEGG